MIETFLSVVRVIDFDLKYAPIMRQFGWFQADSPIHFEV